MKTPQNTHFYHYESIELKAATPECFVNNGIKINDSVYLDKRKINALIKKQAFYAKLSSYNDPLEAKFLDTKKELNEEAVSLLYNRVKTIQSDHAKQISIQALQKTPPRLFLDPFVKAISEDIGCYCLSEWWDDIVMWAHYSSNHTGIVLEFEKKGNNPCNSHTYPISYKETPEELDLSKLLIQLLTIKEIETLTPKEKAKILSKGELMKVFFTKTINWKYEKEWRTSHRHGLQPMPGELTSIIFGYNTKKEVIDYITNIPELTNINFKYITHCFKTFSLKQISRDEYDLREPVLK